MSRSNASPIAPLYLIQSNFLDPNYFTFPTDKSRFHAPARMLWIHLIFIRSLSFHGIGIRNPNKFTRIIYKLFGFSRLEKGFKI